MKSERIAAAFAIFLMFTMTYTLIAVPSATAHDPPLEIKTYPFIYAVPNPAGVGQAATVVFWLAEIPPTAMGSAGDRWYFYLDITKPNGNKETQGPFTSDPTGSDYTRYTPDQVGTYSITVRFGPQLITGSNGTGIYSYSDHINDTYLASSATTTITVQEEALPGPPTYPLPTEYWTRPIEGQNTGWFAIASNWLSSPQIDLTVQPNGVAPNSAHVMWTKPTGFGGVVGGNYTTAEGLTFYDGTAYETFFNFPSGVIIMSGRLYYPLPLGSSTTGGGYVCVDLTTGETLWHKDYAVNPTFGQLYDYESMNQHGVVRNGYLWAVSGGFSYVTFQMEPITWIAYDPWTGDWLFNETNVPSGTSVYGPNGEILIYQLDMAGKWLALWNNTAAHGLTGATDPSDTTSPDFNTWRPVGKIVDMSQAYSWNVTISADLSGQGPPTIIKVIPGDLVLGTSTPDITAMLQEGTPNPYSLWAISDRPGTRGQLLWKKSYPAPSNGITRSTGPMWRGLLLDPATRVFTMYDKETIQWWGYSLDDGSVVWGPTAPEHPLNFYSDFGIPRYDVAYGKLYSVGLSGILYCYDHRTGTLLWNYTSEPSGSASVWPNWPLGIGAIADGKVYLFTTEHSANAPHWRGVQMQCVNATTGERVWTIDTYGCQASMAVADGYFTYYNMYDMQMYCVGKGPSQMTVTSSPKVSTFGSSVLIEGKVTDIAAGTTQPEQAARFPNGVPAVSDESMSSWMEYIYMQKPRPTDVTGVKVSIDIFDSNNNYRNIGTAATDANGAFSLMWKPDIPGKYTVIATFEGTNSYYGSHEETSFGVDEAVSTATPEPTKAPATAADLYLLPGIGAIIAAIAIVGAIIVLMLRKK